MNNASRWPAWLTCAACLGIAGMVRASEPERVASASPTPASLSTQQLRPASSISSSSGLSQLARRLLMENLPETYEDTRKWGKTKSRWDGLHVHRDGWHIKTKRRWKEVNHGLWQLYRLTLVAPEQNLDLAIQHVHEVSPGVVSLQIDLQAPLEAHARRARWHQGVQLFSVSLDADLVAHLQVQAEVRTKLQLTSRGPAVQLIPRVTDARLQLRDYRVRQISKIDGVVAREMGDALEGLVVKKIEEKRHKIVDRMNRQIEKHQDELQVSMRDVLEWIPREVLDAARATGPSEEL